MTKWPNWVDLLIVILLLRACYNGFGRGLLAELLSLIGAVSVTAFTINYASVLTKWIRMPLLGDPILTEFLVFWGFFLILLLIVRFLMIRITSAMKWERLHWSIQGIGLILGGLRGLWWSGFIVAALTSSGFAYLQESVEENSVLGPRLLKISQESLEQTTAKFPGAKHRGETLIPPAKRTTSSSSRKHPAR